jgi:hypothetical protein
MTIRALVAGLHRLGTDLPKLTAAYARWITDDLRRAIDARESPYGVGHAPLAESTVRKKGHDHQLRDSLRLYESLEAQQIGATEIGLECEPDYVEYQMDGTAYMPARPPLPRDTLPDTWRDELDRLFQEHVRATLGRS